MDYVGFDQWIVEAFSALGRSKCSSAANFWVKFNTCPECLSAAYVEAVIRYLRPSLSPEVGACLGRGWGFN